MTKPTVLMVFIDGIGLAADGPDNPFETSGDAVGQHVTLDGFRLWSDGHPWTSHTSRIERHEHVFFGIDACLGVPGLPQSGTGQATLFTGINCAALAGRHFGPWPHSATRDVLRRHNVLNRVKTHTGRDVAFANGFPDVFFERAKRSNRWSTTTRCCLDSGTRLRTLHDMATGNALPADLTGAGLQRFADAPELCTEEESANRLLAVAQKNAFTLFEYFLTDKAGHAQSRSQANTVLNSLSSFLRALYLNRPPALTIVITSDHGNLEDLSVKTHTRNPVPLVVAGPGAGAFVHVKDLTGVVAGIMGVYSPGVDAQLLQ